MSDTLGAMFDQELWTGLQERVRVTKGYVGLDKMLRQRSEAAAGVAWLASVHPILDALGGITAPLIVGPARIAVADGIEIQFDLFYCVIFVDGEARWSSAIYADPAAVSLAALARQRWSDEWVRAIGEAPNRPIVLSQPAPTSEDSFAWVAQNPGGPAPYTTAASEADARLAAAAEERGSVEVQRLFAEFERERS